MAITQDVFNGLNAAREKLVNLMHPPKETGTHVTHEADGTPITISPGHTYSSIPGVGQPYPKTAGVRDTNHDFVSSLPANQKTFGVGVGP